ncbi:BRO-N domain-containing protein [Pasteurella multocida]|uniref:BRO-N domain-containing protein n=1 Tax=Pasteurella multocida TaxID=747 RepID=UPI00064C8384|nr:BRO family protein [Pasteurella multocida]KLT48599.1 antirepressor [Pasteurella multocida subsp. multocida]KLT52915.1 antirepressor [Pasteurella multocida subsp. multocida]KLT58278.1 antirepressor [Pasteurella multocida subsp. multocida]KLT62918.1 antirepressor [Pasteurella multocida subsp. multocida]KLU28296.1 antirepressor [Pasteurella multocida subsp. multocida]
MSNSQISTFDFKSHPVRVELFKNEPHFCLTDVCTALEISNANSSRFKFNEAGVHKMYISFPSGKKEVTFINEPNLYRIIFRSNKKEAIEFQNWVFEEVLPQIRKTGKYEVQSQQLALPEPDLNLTAIQNSEETLALIIQLYSYCFQAHEMQEKLQNTSIAKLMENQIGGQYLYNFKHPLEQVMAKAKKYVHSNTERLALVKAVNNLLN